MTPSDQGICPFRRGLNALFYHASKRYLCALLVSTSLIVAISKGRGSLHVSTSQVGSNLSEIQSKSITLPHTPLLMRFPPLTPPLNSPGDVACLFDTRRRPTKAMVVESNSIRLKPLLLSQQSAWGRARQTPSPPWRSKYSKKLDIRQVVGLRRELMNLWLYRTFFSGSLEFPECKPEAKTGRS